MSASQPLIPPLGQSVSLSQYATDYHGEMSKEVAKELENALEARLSILQEMLYASAEHGVLIVLQAMDAGGKDSTIKKVFDCVNPQGVMVTSFKQPTTEELAHDFLWRIHKQVSPKGYIGIFNRSHYEDVLVVRVNNLVPQAVWEKRYEQINHFERMLVDNGICILKFFLHISKAEQKARFLERLQNPEKHWKFAKSDLAVRAQWDDYMKAYEAALTLCHTEYAPWHIVPSDRKWYRDYVITDAIVKALESLNLRYPAPEDGLETIVIAD